jgi:cytidyltransferase-like protein
MTKIGVVHGRFQPLHLGHLNDYILLAKKECDFIYIGITNPDPSHTKDSNVNPSRSKPENNPFTYVERLIMIKDALIEAGLTQEQFDIIPFPINFPHLIEYYVPKNAVHYMTIFDEWGKIKKVELEKQGLDVKVLFDKPLEDKLISSTLIRKLIINEDSNWKGFVPKAVARILAKKGILKKLIKPKKNSLKK